MSDHRYYVGSPGVTGAISDAIAEARKSLPGYSPSSGNASGVGGRTREDVVMGQAEEAESGSHSAGDENTASNAGKTSQSSDHFNKY